MTETVSLKLVRPYATEEELIVAEGWAIDKKGMVLVDQPRLASGTLVRFELLLEGGKRLLVAEGKAVGYQKAGHGRPGGAKVRFKRFNAAAKAFIERVEAAKAAAPPEPETAPAAELEAAPAAEAEAPPPAGAETAAVAVPRAQDIEESGVRHRARGPVAPPENRDELLERLRERARIAKAREDEGSQRSA